MEEEHSRQREWQESRLGGRKVEDAFGEWGVI